MPASPKPLLIPANSIVDIYDALAIPVGTPLNVQNTGSTKLRISENLIAPDAQVGFYSLSVDEVVKTNEVPIGLWVTNKTLSPGQIQVNSGFEAVSPFPEGAFQGFRALNVQNYIESNIKLGQQHEGSTLLLAVAGGAANNTIFQTGALPVALKSRNVGYTGTGVSTFIFEAPTFTGGASVPYENPNAINPETGLSQIIVGAIVTDDGTLVFAPEHLLGPTSQQAKGSGVNVLGQEKILAPNTAYLFRLVSLDAQAQDITSLLSWYEGELDLPL